MQDGNNSEAPLIPLGIGFILGLGSLLILIKLWPLILLGGGIFLIVKGSEQGKSSKPSSEE